jgi:hypothetical protein
MEKQGIVSSVGNHDFFFVTDLDSGEIFFCHNSRVKDGLVPNRGDKVSFEHLSASRDARKRPISNLEVLNG